MAASAVLLKIGQNIKKYELAHSAILNIAISANCKLDPIQTERGTCALHFYHYRFSEQE